MPQATPCLLVNFPDVAISRLAGPLKAMSSRRLSQELPDLRHPWRQARRLRPGWYFAGSAVGAPVSVQRQYTA